MFPESIPPKPCGNERNGVEWQIIPTRAGSRRGGQTMVNSLLVKVRNRVDFCQLMGGHCTHHIFIGRLPTSSGWERLHMMPGSPACAVARRCCVPRVMCFASGFTRASLRKTNPLGRQTERDAACREFNDLRWSLLVIEKISYSIAVQGKQYSSKLDKVAP